VFVKLLVRQPLGLPDLFLRGPVLKDIWLFEYSYTSRVGLSAHRYCNGCMGV